MQIEIIKNIFKYLYTVIILMCFTYVTRNNHWQEGGHMQAWS